MFDNAFHKLFRIGAPGKLPDDPGPILRLGFGLIFVFVVGGLSWMAFAPLEGAIVSEGVVKVRNERIPVQHSKGGVVSALHVRDGVTVKPQQALFEISEPSRLAGFQSSRYQQISERARNARLRSEQMFSPRVVFPPAVLSRMDDSEVVAIVQQEETVFRNRRDALVTAEAAMKREMALIHQERVQLNERSQMQKEAVLLANEQLSANEDLVSMGFVSRQRILELKRAQVAEQASAGQLEADRLRADQRLADLDRRVAELRNHYLETAAQELKASDDRLHQLEQQVSAQQSEVQRDTITAPVEGTVINMRSLSVGTTVGPMQTVMEIVPSDDSLFVETPVEPRNIRYLHLGGSADIQVTGWNRRTMPLLKATVDYISADAVHLRDDLTAYVVRLKVDRQQPGKVTLEPLKPGMQTIVYVRTPSRTILDYLFEPVIDSMRAAFREPM
ncbi:MAG: HlyD family type I secretion periplasmic adaptor subunit [Burkholderiales bacterium]